MFKYLITALIAITFVGCSFDKDSGDKIKAQKAKDDLRVQELFAPLIGNYDGEMRFNGTTYDISLIIETRTETDPSNTDDNGQPTTKLVPRATLKKNNPVGVETIFDVVFDPAIPQLEFFNVEAKASGGAPATIGPNEIHSIFFGSKGISINAREFIGEVRSKGASSGKITLKPSATEQTNPDENPDQVYLDKLRKIYEPMLGKYVGKSVLNGTAVEYYMTINMRIDNIDDLEVPVLYGIFNRTDDKLGGAELALTFNYTTKSNQFKIDAIPRSFGGSTYRAIIKGQAINNTFKGAWTSTRGFEGDLLLRKVDANGKPIETPTQEDQCLTESSDCVWPTLPEKGPMPKPRPKRP